MQKRNLFTPLLYHYLNSPFHLYAMEVDEFTSMVTDIRALEVALGSGIKEPSKDEMGERVGARRSLYATVDIKEGTVITAGQVKVVRHCYGLPPSEFENVIGKKSKADIKKDMPLTLENV